MARFQFSHDNTTKNLGLQLVSLLDNCTTFHEFLTSVGFTENIINQIRQTAASLKQVCLDDRPSLEADQAAVCDSLITMLDLLIQFDLKGRDP